MPTEIVRIVLQTIICFAMYAVLGCIGVHVGVPAAFVIGVGMGLFSFVNCAARDA